MGGLYYQAFIESPGSPNVGLCAVWEAYDPSPERADLELLPRDRTSCI